MYFCRKHCDKATIMTAHEKTCKGQHQTPRGRTLSELLAEKEELEVRKREERVAEVRWRGISSLVAITLLQKLAKDQVLAGPRETKKGEDSIFLTWSQWISNRMHSRAMVGNRHFPTTEYYSLPATIVYILQCKNCGRSGRDGSRARIQPHSPP